MPELRLILGDQLNPQHSWYHSVSADIHYVLMEMRQETDYVRHHIQKVVGVFLAMRNFAETLHQKGHRVHYLQIDDPKNQQILPDNLSRLVNDLHIDSFAYQMPDEYRLDGQIAEWVENQEIDCQVYDTEHFFTNRTELATFFEGKKQFLMEHFYRHMRRKHQVLMEGDDPVGGRWNFDEENRNKLPRQHILPEPRLFSREVSALLKQIEAAGVETIGHLDQSFIWPISREENLVLLEDFFTNRLASFGEYQDAMTVRDWSLYHARISFGLNLKMISPGEVVRQAEAYWRDHQPEIGLAQIEGFVRQILGWREYMRGLYWAKMPGYATLNFFEHKRKLPRWYWDGDTKLQCLKHSIRQSLQYAYAHHIQRLMITGNFALLAGIHPDEVDQWYLGIYIDAIEWVEITNTRGMSQYADGGIVGSKPYISSANYIHKMSDYCATCAYDRKAKVGKNACPFNSLYWHFYHRHENKLRGNYRVAMMYRVWERMELETQRALLEQAEQYLSQLDDL